jgi:hypothetical protein
MANTAEEAVLFAVLSQDAGEALRLLRDFTWSELNGIDDAAVNIEHLVGVVREERRRAATDAKVVTPPSG